MYRAGGDDGVVVGELPFEETCRERAAGHREAGIAPVEADGHFACFLREDPAGQELCDTSGEAEGCRLTALDVGVGVAHEDAAVGGYRDELLGEEVEIDPCHDGACVVIAGSVEGALEALQQALSGHDDGASFVKLDALRIDVRRGREEAVVPVAIGDGSLPAFAIDVDLDRLVGELLDSVEDDVASYGEGAIFPEVVDFESAGQAVALVCGGEGKYVALKLEEDVFEYGDCCYTFLIDDLGYSLELQEQVVAGDSKFHAVRM